MSVERLRAALAEAADELENVMESHIYDDHEPPNAPERVLVDRWRALLAQTSPNHQVKVVCRACGSDRVLRDAWVRWDIPRQQWQIAQLFESASCPACATIETGLILEQPNVTTN